VASSIPFLFAGAGVSPTLVFGVHTAVRTADVTDFSDH
jgi:hypothetical protein